VNFTLLENSVKLARCATCVFPKIAIVLIALARERRVIELETTRLAMPFNGNHDADPKET
jgi:hypothetical protein